MDSCPRTKALKHILLNTAKDVTYTTIYSYLL
uniref:Uncharacterized protein n=1 Tax=Rhizophora mucronata TaxID=61149 RepID=A0A2P2P761_RHIMU